MRKKITRFVNTDTIGTVDVYRVEIRSIEAWKDDGGWYTNNSYVVCRDFCENLYVNPDITNREVLALLRNLDLTTDFSKGKLCVTVQWPFIDILLKNNLEPIFQIEFIEGSVVEVLM